MTDDILSFSRHIEKSASISPCRNWLESRACQSPPVPASLHGHLLPSSSGCGGWDVGEFCYQSNQSRLSSNQDRESTRSSPAGQHSTCLCHCGQAAAPHGSTLDFRTAPPSFLDPPHPPQLLQVSHDPNIPGTYKQHLLNRLLSAMKTHMANMAMLNLFKKEENAN